MRPTFRTLKLPACLKGEGQPAMYFDAFLSPVNINFVEFEFAKSCALAKQYRSCFNLFHPSTTVEELVRQEPQLERLRKSTAVFVDEVSTLAGSIAPVGFRLSCGRLRGRHWLSVFVRIIHNASRGRKNP